MSFESSNLEFGEFLFDSHEGVLLRNNKPVPLTPKTLSLLRILIQNRGHVVEKQELMGSIWGDSFVEDGNLTFTIRLLRKALHDERGAPRYIATVPKRGYRFIADVTERSTSNGAKPPIVERTDSPAPLRVSGNKKILLLSLVLIGAVVATSGMWFVTRTTTATDFPVFQSPFNLQPLSTDGHVALVVISQDGKELVYVKEVGGKQEVWLRRLDSTNNVQIIPPTDDRYFGLALSPDGNFLYFTRRPQGTDAQTDIYRISIFGGAPKTIAKEAQGWISISPDGEKMSFVRCYYRADENCSLWLGNSDGGSETRLSSRITPFRIGGNSISPDGTKIAFAVGQSENSANDFGLNQVDINSGAETEITAEKFFNIKNVQWLPDGKALLMTARKNTDPVFRIWRVSALSGEARPVTSDGTDYSALSIDRDADKVVSTRVRHDARLRLYSLNGHVFSPDIIDAESLSFSPDGKLFFSSRMTGNDEIWSSNIDGSDKRQLTVNDGKQDSDDSQPIVSPDNSYIFFSSNRTGQAQIWRIRMDGGDQTQITFGEGGDPRWVSPDGAWLYYRAAMNSALWRVRTSGGFEEPVLSKSEGIFRISPDGQYLAYVKSDGSRQELVIDSLTDGRTIKTFPIRANSVSHEVAWYADGNSVVYVSMDKEHDEKVAWRQGLDGSEPERITSFGSERISELAVSPDGLTLAVAQGDWKNDATLITGLR